MANPPDDEVPELLRKRVMRQRRRLKIVRFTFALTAGLSVLLLFIANQSQTLAPTARTIQVIRAGETLWLLDQHLDFSGQKSASGGSFAIVKGQGEEFTQGMRYDGLVRYAVAIDENHIGLTTPSRFMLFDVSGEEWERKRMDPLRLNDPSAAPVVVPFDGTLWLCWVRGRDIMVRPLEQPDVEPKALHKTSAPGAGLGAVVTDDALWLSVRETRSKDLTLISFTPSIEPVPEEPAPDKDADATPAVADEAEDDTPDDTEVPEARLRTGVRVHLNTDVTSNVGRSTFAIVGDRPVVGVSRDKESDRSWTMLVWTRDDKATQGRWESADAPPRESAPSGMELSNFMSLRERDGRLFAIYNDGSDVKSALAEVKNDGALEWQEASLVPIDKTTGAAGYVVWVTILFGMLLIMASQGVWLLLNRERPMDRTLAEILERREKESGDDKDNEKKKNIPKLLYANGFARATALLLDIAMTSPIIILLQSVYGYTWEQAYGFLAIGSVSSLDTSMIPVIQATLVTLGVLAVYGMACEMFWGKTFGKALFRLRVVDAEGEAPAAWRIVVRNFVKIFELIHWIVLLIPMALMMMTGKQQRLGDLLAGTYVIVDLVPEEMPDDIDI